MKPVFKKLLILEAVLLLGGLLLYAIPLHRYTYTGNQLKGSLCRNMAYGDYEEGCYLDESFITDDTVDASLLYMTTPEMDLSRGSYEVSVVYSTNDADQKYAVTSKYRTYPVITGNDGNRIAVGDHTLRFSFCSPIQVEGFQVHLNYSGSGYLFAESISVCETNAWKNMILFYMVLAFAALDGAVFWYGTLPADRRREARILFVTMGFLTVYASVPLLTFFMPQGVDLLFHTNRIEAIKEAFLAGQFPSRVSPFWNRGYGYASGVFYGEIFLYVPAFLRLIGFSVQGAYKLYVVFVNLATAWIAYYCFKKAFNHHMAALIGSMVYTLAPVRLVCIYLRAAVGEYTAMTFFPLVFYGLFRIYVTDSEDKDESDGCIPLLLGFTGLLQCHLISTMIAGMFVAFFCLLCIRKTLCGRRLLRLARAFAGTVLLNLWFLVPFADYLLAGYTNTANEFTKEGRLNAYGALFNQMFTLFQDGAGSAYMITAGMSQAEQRNYALGGFILTAFLYVFFRAYKGRDQSVVSRAGDCGLVFAFTAVFMCTIWFPWDFIQQLSDTLGRLVGNIQFPWRFLGIACFFFTVVTVCLLLFLRGMGNKPLYYAAAAVICSFFIISADFYMYSYTENAVTHRNIHGSELDSCNLGAGEYLPPGTPADFAKDTTLLFGEGVEILQEAYDKGVHRVDCRSTGDADAFIDLPLIPYKGYSCRDEGTGEKLAVRLDTPGKVRVVVPAGYEGTFLVKYKEPWYWRAAEAVSALTLFGWAAGRCVRQKKAKA